MKIGLVCATMKDNDPMQQIKQIKHYISTYRKFDLLCFGESFLQGFEGLTWQYEEDLKRALRPDGPFIQDLQNLAANYNCGLSLGFIEREGKLLYSSNLVLDSQGEIKNIYRRTSPGWKEPSAGPFYQEGQGPFAFSYQDKTFATAICGDLWDDGFLKQMKEIRVDALFWPVYLDFSVEEWFEDHLPAYVERTASLSCPVYFVNSVVAQPGRAQGGAYVFQGNKITARLPMGNIGVLGFELS